MKITESRTNDILHWLDDETGNHALLFEKMTLHRDAAALIRQLQAAEQAAWHAGLDAGREQERGKDHTHQPEAVDEAMVERALAAYLRRQDDGESLYGCVTAALSAALTQQPAAVNEAMVERIAALLHEEATGDPWTVAGVEHPGPDRDYYLGLARKVAALAQQPAAVDAKDAEIEALREALDWTVQQNDELLNEGRELTARAERLAEALREMREYVTAALQAEREAFAGHEDCSDIPGIEADLHKIDAMLREQEEGA